MHLQYLMSNLSLCSNIPILTFIIARFILSGSLFIKGIQLHIMFPILLPPARNRAPTPRAIANIAYHYPITSP